VDDVTVQAGTADVRGSAIENGMTRMASWLALAPTGGGT
jgi:hypothetical protein